MNTMDNTEINEVNVVNSSILFERKVFNTWQQALDTIESQAKQNGFNIRYNRVERKPDGSFRKRSIECEHQGML